MTPKTIDEHVNNLVELINTNTTPIYLEVKPEPYSQVCECFPSVAEKIRRDGGTQVLGWQIWKTNILAEAEFHAVWMSPKGELKDITPKQANISKILFLSDPKKEYVGSPVDNIRLNITNNHLVDDFIEICKAIFRIENKGDRAFKYELQLRDEDANMYVKLNAMKEAVYYLITSGGNRNSPCFCQAGSKYRLCHGKQLKKWLRSV